MLLAISGSPKKKSNTTSVLEYLVEEVTVQGFTSNLINLADLNINPCKDCGFCRKSPNCAIDDDFSQLIELFLKAKVIIFGSPVYFGSVTAQLKALMDRTVLLRRAGGLLQHKYFGGVAIGGSRNGGQELTLQTMHNWALIHGMFVMPDALPTSHFGGALVARGPAEAMQDQIGLETINNLAKNVIKILRG
ncbi:MAG: flavodoxin family protein [Candidatus Margulisiibacteriota bacterium]|jgi:multimeric flavodoxin WrbA